jgi:hypothetical protein
VLPHLYILLILLFFVGQGVPALDGSGFSGVNGGD